MTEKTIWTTKKRIDKIENKLNRDLAKDNIEVFCIKKCQFVRRKDTVKEYHFVTNESKSYFSEIYLTEKEWKLYEENKDCWWFRRKNYD